jgi:5-formyltetrahydrofolate cyclo-ligase
MDDILGAASAKPELRRRLLAARALRPPEQLAAAGESLARHAVEICRRHRRVAAYADIAGEPPTGPLRAKLREAGVEVLLPVITGDTLRWAPEPRDARLTAGPLGTGEPPGPSLSPTALGGAGVVIVPALAVDRRGRRLGRGRGYYDRALADLDRTRTTVVACVFADEVLDEVPAETHDVSVDAVLTPDGLHALGPA